MIKSMTGYGRGEQEQAGRKFVVEMKSVNHRYNDISIKLPRFMNQSEDKIRKIIMQQVARGKTDVYISFETFSEEDITVTVNEALADAYTQALKQLQRRYSLPDTGMLSLVAKFADVITVEKVQEKKEVYWEILEKALLDALDAFCAMRIQEGEHLKTDILKKTKGIQKLIEEIKERAPLVAEDFRQRLSKRLKELLENVPVEEQRIAAEVTIYADRGCIDEELTRLDSHVVQLVSILEEGGLAGRKLDFLVQEMNREANTIASKANDIQIAKAVIEMKSEIEKIREQVQNIE